MRSILRVVRTMRRGPQPNSRQVGTSLRSASNPWEYDLSLPTFIGEEAIGARRGEIALSVTIFGDEKIRWLEYEARFRADGTWLAR